MREFMEITRALADENRVRILCALRGRELCVCQVIDLLGLAPSTVSKHMAILKHARLVESRKEGRWIYYRLADPEAPEAVHEAIDWVHRSMEKSGRCREDRERLAKILEVPPEVLCHPGEE